MADSQKSSNIPSSGLMLGKDLVEARKLQRQHELVASSGGKIFLFLNIGTKKRSNFKLACCCQGAKRRVSRGSRARE